MSANPSAHVPFSTATPLPRADDPLPAKKIDTLSPSTATTLAPLRPAPRNSPAEFIIDKRFANTLEFEHTLHTVGPDAASPAALPQPVDFLFLTEDEPHDPADIFDRLRWGGQLIYISRHRNKVDAVAKSLLAWGVGRGELGQRNAWVLEEPLAVENRSRFRFLGFRSNLYFCIARKVMLAPPGRSTDRFTYNVYLDKNAEGTRYEVVKEVPTLERVLARLQEKFPDADPDTLRRRAKKFTDRIFPIFLTRETAMLRLLSRDLPKQFHKNVPHVISADVDAQGYTRKLRMKWLRNGRMAVDGKSGHHGRPLSQLEFARQAAELLAALHDDVGIMHLDLRLDNVVITNHGVGFVDFGSAVRVGESFAEAPMLSNLFDEMMRTSQIQRMLGKMTATGQVTSDEICNSFGKIDKAVDFFYLAVQINNPHANPDFRGLVDFSPDSPEAKHLATLTDQILRPEDPHKSPFTSAHQILQGIQQIEKARHA